MIWFEQFWLLLLIDVSVKSIVLAVVAWLTMRALRVRDANVRHRVWSTVLAAMLTLPILVPLSPAVSLPHWLLPWIPTSAKASLTPDPDGEPKSTPTVSSTPPAGISSDPDVSTAIVSTVLPSKRPDQVADFERSRDLNPTAPFTEYSSIAIETTVMPAGEAELAPIPSMA